MRMTTGSPVVFVFFDPWTLGTRRHIGMLEFMLEQGFVLLDFEFETLSEADAEEIYRTNHPIREGNSWHVARLVYPMGPSLGLLLGSRDEDSCACSRMQYLKGKANPALNRAGQLRYEFLAPNRCLSLMHSSDDLSQVRREGSVFFSTDRLDRACALAHDGATRSKGALQQLTTDTTGLGIERIDEPGLAALFARIRLRLIKELRRLGPLSCATESNLLSYQSLWEPLSRQNTRGHVISEAKQYLQALAQEREPLAAITAGTAQATRERAFIEFYRPPSCDRSAILQCLQILNQPRSYSRWDSDRQLPPHILHDRWEQLLFQTHLFNFDDMLAAAG
jgi:nucleoside diphosphate kinase